MSLFEFGVAVNAWNAANDPAPESGLDDEDRAAIFEMMGKEWHG